MVADSVPIAVPPAWQSPGEIFTGIQAKPGQQQKYNHSNPAEIACWEVRCRAYLEDRDCLDAIRDPRIKDFGTFAAEYTVNDAGERPSAEETQKAYKAYKDSKDAARRKAYNILVQWPGVLSDPLIMQAVETGSNFDRTRDALGLYNKLIARKNCADPESQEAVQRTLSLLQVGSAVLASAIPPTPYTPRCTLPPCTPLAPMHQPRSCASGSV